ncbi:MAG TPA: hypothetical protein VE890_13700 [Thermoguttaceae bacterium]|nr:hypothetical protein [Thermoguttaceae bacterium]
MKLLDRLDRRFGRFAVPNLTAALIAAQVIVYVLGQGGNAGIVARIALIPSRVLEGEAWRLVSFVAQPPGFNLFFAFFFWYLFYLMGTTLEHTWGVFRYNVFLLIGYVATVAVSFITPEMPASVAFLQGSVFLAFAWLYPDFQLMLMFILPVKIKWLALLAWIGYFMTIGFGDLHEQLIATAAVANFLLFFGSDILLRMRSGRRRMAYQADRIKRAQDPNHRCAICGITDKSNPTMLFRYCSKCTGGLCYCADHLKDHEHVVAEEAPPR